MSWTRAYALGVYPYLWVYAIAMIASAVIFLILPRLRRHMAPVVLLLVGRQVLDTVVLRYVPNYEGDISAPAWVGILHFAFFVGMVHYTYIAAREYLDLVRAPGKRRRSTLLGLIANGTVLVTAAMIYLRLTQVDLNFGIGIASLAAVVGFALQETLANLFAGITLEADPPFRVGDWITGEGFVGEVIDITWRATRLRTYENDTLVIPNRQLANAMIVNWSSFSRTHGVHMSIGASYVDAPGRVKQSLLTALSECEGVLKSPPPEVYTKDYGDFSITHDVLFFITDYKEQNRIKDRFLSRVWYQFRRDSIRIPFPIRDVNLHMLSSRERAAEAGQEMQRKIAILEQLKLFTSLPPEEIRFLASEAHFQRYWKGENIIRQGDVPCFLSILVEGNAKVLLHTGDLAARDRDLVVHRHEPDGHELTEIQHPAHPPAATAAPTAVAATPLPPVDIDVQGGYAEVSQLKAGDFFGEISVLLGKEASATVQSADELLLLVVDREAFVTVLEKHREFQELMCGIISERVRLLHQVSKLAQNQKDEVEEEPRTLLHHLRRFLHLNENAPAR